MSDSRDVSLILSEVHIVLICKLLTDNLMSITTMTKISANKGEGTRVYGDKDQYLELYNCITKQLVIAKYK